MYKNGDLEVREHDGIKYLFIHTSVFECHILGGLDSVKTLIADLQKIAEELEGK